MEPSIWSTPDRTLFVVTTGVDPSKPLAEIRKTDGGWVIVDDVERRAPFAKLQEAADAVVGMADVEYKDYLLGKGEDSRTVFTSAEQLRRITDEGGWKLISASAPRLDDVN